MKKLAKYILCITAILCSYSALSAADKEKSPSPYIQLVPSSELIRIKIQKGKSLYLPLYKKTISPHKLSVYGLTFDSFHSDISLTADSLSKEIAIRKEIQELSQKLGIEIKDRDKLDLFRTAADWLGTRYRRGSMSRKGVDCSGFTNIVYNTVFEKKIPRVSYDIANNLEEELPLEDLAPGDLVFFSTLGRKRINHVGVYLGDGSFVHASIKQGVIVSTLNEGYYQRTFKKAGKI